MPSPIDRGAEKSARSNLVEASHSFGFHSQFTKTAALYNPILTNSTTRIAKVITIVVFFIFLNNFRAVSPFLLLSPCSRRFAIGGGSRHRDTRR